MPTAASDHAPIRGACGHDCPDTCAWTVDVQNGAARRLAGDPAHPFTRGTLCAKVNHYLERVYHPDRVLHPLKRTGRKGEGKFTPVSWPEALADIAARWQAIMTESGAEAILPYSSAGVQGVIQQASLDRRLFGSMGCTALQRAICGGVASAGMRTTIGVGSGIDPETSSTAATSCCGARTPSSPTCTTGRMSAKRSGAAPAWSWWIRCAHGRPTRPTGTCQSRRPATRRWRWR